MAEFSTAAPLALPKAEIMGHPRGIFVLFMAEMWERFSYYGMRALLIFYLTQHFAFPDVASTQYYGAYTSLVFAFSILGGFLADRAIGQWRSLRLGGLLILSGHVLLAVEGAMGAPNDLTRQIFFAALGLIIAGTGFFKPCASTMVGALYASGDHRRQTGFFIFYVGVNLGAALAALSVGYLGQAFGWSYGFGAAAVGMALGLLFLQLGQGDLAPFAMNAPSGNKSAGLTLLLALACTTLGWVLVQNPAIVGIALVAVVAGAFFVLGRYILREADATERRHLFAVIILFLGVSVYWSTFEQAGSSLNLFADRVVRMELLGMTFLSSQSQFFNPAFILLVTPVLALLWATLARLNREPSVGFKFSLGLGISSFAFFLLSVSIGFAGSEQRVGLEWLIGYFLFQTIAELCISPIGLSIMTQISPKKLSGLVMGLWLMGSSAGNYLGAQIATLTARADNSDLVVDTAAEAARYGQVFGYVAIYAAMAAIIFLGLSPTIRRLVAQR